jgi:hypothetical protein
MANIKISELNPLLTVEDADVLPIVDNAVTKKVTAAILRSYTEGNSVLLTGAQTIAGIKTFTSQLASSVATGTAPFSVASTTKVTNLNADLLDGLSSADFQATLSGTGIVKSTAGTISYLTDNSSNWNTAYNDSIVSAAVTGTTTKTLTLNQQDGGSVTASWTDDNTDAVTSVFGRTGAVVATSGDYTTTQVTEGTNLYFTDARARAAISLTTTGTSGVATYVSGVLNIPNYGSALSAYVPYTGATTNVNLGTHSLTASDLVINHASGSGVAASISKGGSGEALTVVKSSGSGNAASITGGTTLISELNLTTDLADAYIASAATWNAKQNAITLTTTGTSGAATLVGATLNIPQYQSVLTNPITGTGTTNYLPKFTGASALGNSLVYDDGTNVGIGTTTPDRALTVNGQISLNGDLISTKGGTTFRIGYESYTATGGVNMFTESAVPLVLGTTSTERMRITSAGNLGIGTTTPSEKLHVSGGNIIVNSSSAIGWGDRSAQIVGVTGASGFLRFDTNNAEVMRINESGFVGIGTTTPLSILETKEANRTNGSNITNVGIYSTSAQDTGVGGTIGFGGLFTGSDYAPFGSIRGGKENNTSGNYAGYLAFQTIQNGGSLVERGRFASSGNLLIGTTTDSGYKLDVNGTTRLNGVVTFLAEDWHKSTDGKLRFYFATNGLTYIKGDGVELRNNVDAPLLNLASTGAATFSSSVTAADAILSNIKPSINFTLSVNPAFSHSIVGENYSSGAAANNYMDLKVANAANSQQLALRLFGTGAAEFSAGLSLNSATAPASGIEFPATQVASASANNLDDYEEGTWTPTITFNGGSVAQTYGARVGSYVKIGRQVTVTCYIEFTNKGTSTGGAIIEGLPFPAATGLSFFSAPSIGDIRNINFLGFVNLYVNQGASTITMGQTSTLGTFSTLNDTNFANNSEFILTATYFV